MVRRESVRALDAARVVGLAMVIGGAAPWASASFSASAKATASGAGTDSDESTNFTGSATAEKENTRGGHGYGYANVDFLGGTVAARAHGCVGSNDTGVGDTRARATTELLTVTADTLPVGTPVEITFCYSVSLKAEKLEIQEPQLVGPGSIASAEFHLNVNNITKSGYVQLSQKFAVLGTGGIFAGETGSSVTRTESITFTKNVGQSFYLTMDVEAYTYAVTSSATGLNPIASGAAGAAATFGATTPSGVHLQWNGIDWMGNCGDSSGLIPPNPVEPTPGALGAFGFAAAGVARRKR